MKRNYSIYLKDVLKAFDSIDNFVKGLTFEEFVNDDKTSSAVIIKFEIIVEATKHLHEASSVFSRYIMIAVAS